MILSHSQQAMLLPMLVIGALAVTGAQAGPAEPRPGARVATVVFLSYTSSGHPQFDPAALHAGCWDGLAAMLRSLGESEVPRQEMEPIMRRFGVRTSLSISGDFLGALAAEGGAGELLVFDLIVHTDRILLCGRGVRTDTGRIDWADLEELPLGAEAAETAGDRLLRGWRERPMREESGPELFLLPVRIEGLEAAVGPMVMACLLRRLVDSPWRIQDPGVTFSRLRQAGSDPGLFDGRARPALAAAGASFVLVSDIVAYDTRGASSALEFQEEAPAGPATALPASALSVRLIDGESGNVRSAATEYLGMPPTHGLFGMARSVSLIERVQPAADRLVSAIRKKG